MAANFKDQGDTFYQNGTYSSALEAYLKALELESLALAKLHAKIAAVHLRLQQPDKALEAAASCSACDPTWLNGYIRLAEVHRTMGNDDLALETLGDQVLEKDPDNEVANRMVDEMLKKKFEKFDAQVEEEKYKGWAWSIGVSLSSILLLHLLTGNGALVFRTCVYMLLQFCSFLGYVGSIHSGLHKVLKFFLASAIVYGWRNSQGPKRWRILWVVRLGITFVATSFLCAVFIDWRAQQQQWDNAFIDWRAEQQQWDNGKYYHVLDLPKTATAKAIKTGFHSQAMIHHPDKVKYLENDNADTFAKKIKRATEKFVEIKLAYSILSNEAKKEVYDGCGLWGMEAMNRGICEEKDFRQCCDKVREILSTNQYQDSHARPPPPHYQPHEF